ncbi:hypothetical protein IWQ51_004073 [Labrenzia sp. EL_142]|nr:hypothetical protein [Labrenzia sp. EL_142]
MSLTVSANNEAISGRDAEPPAPIVGGGVFGARKVTSGEAVYKKWLSEAGISSGNDLAVLHEILKQNSEIESLLNNEALKNKSRNLIDVEGHFTGRQIEINSASMLDALLRLNVQDNENLIGRDPNLEEINDEEALGQAERSLGAEDGAWGRLAQRFERICRVSLPEVALKETDDEPANDWIGSMRESILKLKVSEPEIHQVEAEETAASESDSLPEVDELEARLHKLQL